MSLDVYLTEPGYTPTEKGSGIFVRENGATIEITREEWDAKFPGREPIVIRSESCEVYSRNITHNLNRMADAAGIYEAMWHPDDIKVEKARDLIEPLQKGLSKLKSDPDGFSRLNPSNGWGNYEGLVNFVEEYLAACMAYPDAEVSVSR